MKSRKMYSWVGVACLLAALITGCGSSEKASNSQASVSGKDTFFFVGEQGYDPISFEENGQVVGISSDLVKEAFRRMGYKVNLQLVPWKKAQEMVKEGEADGFFSCYRLPHREENYTFPKESLLVEKNVFVVRKDSTINFDGNVGKLAPYGVGTITGYATLDPYVEKRLIGKVDQSQSIEEALNKLISGDRGVDLVVNTSYIIWYTARKMNKVDAIKELNTPLSENPAYLAFTKKKDMTGIAAKFDYEMKKMKEDGTYNKIIERYIGVQRY